MILSKEDTIKALADCFNCDCLECPLYDCNDTSLNCIEELLESARKHLTTVTDTDNYNVTN